MGLAILTSTMFGAFWGYKARWLRYDPSPTALMEYYWDENMEEVISKVAAGMADSYSENDSTIHQKAMVLNWALLGAAVGVSVLLLSVFAR